MKILRCGSSVYCWSKLLDHSLPNITLIHAFRYGRVVDENRENIGFGNV